MLTDTPSGRLLEQFKNSFQDRDVFFVPTRKTIGSFAHVQCMHCPDIWISWQVLQSRVVLNGRCWWHDLEFEIPSPPERCLGMGSRLYSSGSAAAFGWRLERIIVVVFISFS